MKNYIILSLFILLASFLQAQISGTVFRDFNGNGTQQTSGSTIEPGISGISVKAFDSDDPLNTPTATATTSSTGTYTLGGLSAGVSYRIEFSWTSSWLHPSRAGGTKIQFATNSATGVDLAVNEPFDYVGTTNPKLYVPCYVNGDPLAVGSESDDADVFVGFDYTSSGATPSGLLHLAYGGQIGSCWGVAHNTQANKLFTSAFMKRHIGFGPANGTAANAPGAIYMIDPTKTATSSPVAASYFTSLDALGFPSHNSTGTPAYGAGTSYSLSGTYPYETVSFIGAGAGVIGTNAQRGLPTGLADPSYDVAAFDQIGKVSLGDMEISPDGLYLYVVNLYDRKIYRLTLNSASNPTSVTATTSYSLPNPPLRNTLGGGYATTYSGDSPTFYDGTKGTLRPFGLKYYRGKLYVGAVTTGEGPGAATTTDNNTGNPEYTDIWAYVFELDASTGNWASTPTIQFPLNFPRLVNGDGADETWELWTNKWSNNVPITWPQYPYYPQPILSGLEFDDDGTMLLNFRDRIGDQTGYLNYGLSGTDTYSGIATGDILRAYWNASSGLFELESNGKEGPSSSKPATAGASNGDGPGGGEFYYQDGLWTGGSEFQTFHKNMPMGSHIMLRGSGQVASTGVDPNVLFSGGIDWMDNTTGENPNDVHVYATTGSNGTSGKANGLGDLEMYTTPAPIEIGNRVWNDTDGDGVQDADENGIANVAIELYPDFDNNGSPDNITANTGCNAKAFSTAASVACSGTIAWTNPTRALTNDGTLFSAASLTSTNTTSRCLQLTGAGFNIPSYATITGITVTINRRSSGVNLLTDNAIQLIVGGTVTGNNYATATSWPNTFTNASYGGTTDLWGLTPTPAQVNASDFGVSIQAIRTAGSPQARVEYVEISVCYSTPGGVYAIATTSTASSGAVGTWYFNTTNVGDGDPTIGGSQAGLAAGKNYLVRIGSTDWTGGAGAGDLAGLALATANNATGASQPDEIDNDGTLVSTIPQIAVVIGDAGQNNHSLDFGFRASCIISGTFTKNAVVNNGTPNDPNDDYFTVQYDATSTNGGASGKYEALLILNGDTTVLNPGGTAYGTPFTGGANLFIADSTVYALAVRDLDIPVCFFDPPYLAANCVTPGMGTIVIATGTCSGGTVNNNAQVTLSGFTNVDKMDFSTGATYSGAAYGAGSNRDLTDGGEVITGLAHNTQYTLRFWSGSALCYDDSTISIPNLPVPTVTDPGDQSVCHGASTTTVTFSGSAVPGTVYNWTNNTTSIGLAASGTGNIAAFTASNTSSTPVTATITVTPTANGCEGAAQTFAITVNPQPNIADATKTCPGGGGPAPSTHDFAFTGTWSITSQPAATASVSGAGAVTGMTLVGDYSFLVSVNGCSDTATITVPACCPIPNCVIVKLTKID